MQGDNSNDAWIFSLAVLLSSTLVYNSMGTINQEALDQLRYGDEREGSDSVPMVVTALTW